MTAGGWRLTRHRLRRFGQVDARRRLLLIEAIARLIAARAQLAIRPFPALAREMGGFVAPRQANDLMEGKGTSLSDRALAGDIGWAVTSAARHVPFSAVCLPQAMAARQMLKSRKLSSVMHFGTPRDAAVPLQAHAWLDMGGVQVTGYPVNEDCTEIACLAYVASTPKSRVFGQ